MSLENEQRVEWTYVQRNNAQQMSIFQRELTNKLNKFVAEYKPPMDVTEGVEDFWDLFVQQVDAGIL
jgi:hypothetical protein